MLPCALVASPVFRVTTFYDKFKSNGNETVSISASLCLHPYQFKVHRDSSKFLGLSAQRSLMDPLVFVAVTLLNDVIM